MGGVKIRLPCCVWLGTSLTKATVWIYVGFALRRTSGWGPLPVLNGFSPLKTAVSSKGSVWAEVDSRAAFQFLGMLSWISKNWHTLRTLFSLVLHWRHDSFPKEGGKKKALWMCKQQCPYWAYIDSPVCARKRKAVYLPCLSWYGFVWTCSLGAYSLRGVSRLWGWRGCRACCALFTASGVACK